MEKLNYKQILEVLKMKLDNVEDFGCEDYNVEELGLGEIKVADKTGGEGQGEHWHSVKHFVDHDIYIKVTGFYSSQDGVSFYQGWDDCEEVRPYQKTITVYE